MSKILVTGSHGQLGSEIRTIVQNNADEYTSEEFFFTAKDTLDIRDTSKIEAFIQDHNIDIIINCTAYTAVDNAESNIMMADEINREAVRNLALLSLENSVKLIHISTDYLFDGTTYKPYIEETQSNPQGIYSKTKLAGEQELKQVNPPEAIIIRTSWIYSSFGANFVKTMLRLGREKDEISVVFDQIGTPTYARDLAGAILWILKHPLKSENRDVAIYHYSNEGVASWYDFAKAIFEFANIKCDVKPIETYQYPTPAKRPYYSVLNKSKIKNTYNLKIPYWRDSLKECIDTIAKESSC